MDSIGTDSIQQNDDDLDRKSRSTIVVEFSEPMIPKPTTNYDEHKSCSSSFEIHHRSRKRHVSKRNQQITDENENTNKKQRNLIDHLAYSENAYYQQLTSLTESNQSQHDSTISKQNHQIVRQRSVSVQNDSDNHRDWFKDFMQQSLDTIRDTIMQACLTAISTQVVNRCNSNNATRHMTTHDHDDDDDDDDEQHEDSNVKQRIHRRARTSPYPLFENILRTFVSDVQVPWSYEWPQYEPTIFTAEEIYINPGADPDLIKSPFIPLRFNSIDGPIDRRSVYQHYHICEHDGLPLNPIGRTGLKGRGVLLRWGPNIYQYILICRWKRDVYGNVLLHPSNGKKILEILLELQASDYRTHDLILTGGLHMLGSRFPPQLQDRLKRFIIHAGIKSNNRKQISSSLMALNNLFQQNPTSWKGAYFDDNRNTDNAWIELCIEYIIDSDQNHQLTSCIPRLSTKQLEYIQQPRFIWKDVENAIAIGPRTHYRLIRNLAYKLDAYF